jgi:hypothetical protein
MDVTFNKGGIIMRDSFSDRMDAQRAVLKQVNQVAWPQEELFALSEDAIQRWVSVNRLGDDNEIVKLAREAGDALLFLANASQEQIAPEYASHVSDVTAILERLRSVMTSTVSIA